MMTAFEDQPSQDWQSQVYKPTPDAAQTEQTQEEVEKVVP